MRRSLLDMMEKICWAHIDFISTSIALAGAVSVDE